MIKAGNRKDEAMKTRISWMVGLMVLGVAAAWMLAGCETYSNVDREIVITPAEVGFTNFVKNLSYVQTFYAGEHSTNSEATTNGTVTLSTNLYYPLEWRVSDPSIGVIIDSTGNSAIYRTFPNIAGVNIIYCRDQSGREGQAVARSTFPIPEDAAEPSASP